MLKLHARQHRRAVTKEKKNDSVCKTTRHIHFPLLFHVENGTFYPLKQIFKGYKKESTSN